MIGDGGQPDMDGRSEKPARLMTPRRRAELQSRLDHAHGVWLGYYNAVAEEKARHEKQVARLKTLMERQAKRCDAIYAEMNGQS